MRKSITSHLSKAQTRSIIKQGIEAFTRAGGEIKKIPMGVSGLDVEQRKELRRAHFPEGEKVVKSVEPITREAWAEMRRA